MPSSEALKRAKAKYYQKNKEKIINIIKNYCDVEHPTYRQDYYRNNIDYIRERNRNIMKRKYMFFQEARRLSNILL